MSIKSKSLCKNWLINSFNWFVRISRVQSLLFLAYLEFSGEIQKGRVDLLEEPEIRQGIKEYANWPTIPQLYINGEFVGGCDIMIEMYQSGELQKLLGKATV